jgi:hypothetical protein
VGKHILSTARTLLVARPPMLKLYVGLDKNIELPPQKDGYLLIDDDLEKWGAPQPIIFDPQKDCFNPLQDIDRKKAREIARLLYTASPQGENTLTVRNGRRALAAALVNSERFDKLRFDKDISKKDISKEARQEVNGMIDDLLFTEVMRKVLCNRTNFSFNPRSLTWPESIGRSSVTKMLLYSGCFSCRITEGKLFCRTTVSIYETCTPA